MWVPLCRSVIFFCLHHRLFQVGSLGCLVGTCVQWRFSCVQLCDPMDCGPPASSVRGILQGRTLDWVAISLGELLRSLYLSLMFPSQPWGIEASYTLRSSARRSFKWWLVGGSVAQSCPALRNPMDCSTPGFPVLRQILEFAQTRVHRVGDAVITSSSATLFSFCLKPFSASGEGWRFGKSQGPGKTLWDETQP